MKLKKIKTLSAALASATTVALAVPIISSCGTSTPTKPVDPTPVDPQPQPQPEEKKADSSFFEIVNGEIKGFNPNKTKAEIQEYCKDGVLRLPPVKVISADAFNAQLKDAPFGTVIEIAAATKEIGQRAFFANTATEVKFTGGASTSQLTTIGEDAFAFCKGLTSFTFPAGLFNGTISKGAFFGCSNLAEFDCSLYDGSTPFTEQWSFGAFRGVAANGKVSFTGDDATAEEIKTNMSRAWTRLVFNGVNPQWSLAWKATGSNWTNQIKAVPNEYLKITSGSLTESNKYIWPLDDTNFNVVNVPNQVTALDNDIREKLINVRQSITKWNFAETTITSVPAGAFQGLGTADSAVYLPDSVTILGNNAFNGWLGTVSLKSDSLTDIGESALSYTHYLNKSAASASENGVFTIASTLATVGDHAFEGSDIKKFDFSALGAVPSTGWTGSNIFTNTGSFSEKANYSIKLKTLTSPAGDVDQWQLRNNFKNFLIGHGLNEDTWTFAPTVTLDLNKILEIDSGVLKGWKKNVSGVELTKEEVSSILTEYPSIGQNLVIPKTVTSIDNNAFFDTENNQTKIPSGITRITFAAESTCTSIGKNAFKNSTINSLTLPTTITDIGDSAFDNCSALATIDVSEFGIDNVNNLTIGNHAFRAIAANGMITNKNTIDATHNQIDQWELNYTLMNKFKNAGISTLTTKTDSNWKFTVTDIAEIFDIQGTTINGWALKGNNTALTDEYKLALSEDKHGAGTGLVIPSGVTAIADDAFNPSKFTTDTEKDKHAVLPAGFSTLNFQSGSSLITIGSGAFNNNTNLTAINFTNATNLTTIGSVAFNATGITSLTLPDSLTTIGDGAFYNNASLTKITIPQFTNEITMGDGVFGGNTLLAEIDISAYLAVPNWKFSGKDLKSLFSGCATKGTIYVSTEGLKESMFAYIAARSDTISSNYENWPAAVRS